MELIKIEISKPGRWDADAAAERRAHVDELAKRSFIAQAESRKKPTLSAPNAVTTRPAVTLKELAVRLKMDRSACRRYILALGYEPVRQRTADSGYQVALTFTAEQADEIFAKRRAEGYC